MIQGQQRLAAAPPQVGGRARRRPDGAPRGRRDGVELRRLLAGRPQTPALLRPLALPGLGRDRAAHGQVRRRGSGPGQEEDVRGRVCGQQHEGLRPAHDEGRDVSGECVNGVKVQIKFKERPKQPKQT